MNRELRYKAHSSVIKAWIESIDSSLFMDGLIDHFDNVLSSVLAIAQTSTSEITLAAVLDRVIYNSSEQFPILKQLKINSARLDFSIMKKNNKTFTCDQIRDAFHYLITEIFFIIGNITAEQLTPILYQALKNENNKPLSKAKPKESK